MMSWRRLFPALPLVLSASWSGASAATFALAPDQVLVGAGDSYVTRKEDTLLDVARNNDLGYSALMTANAGIDPWLPGDGKTVTLPKQFMLPDGPRKGIVIDIAAQRLWYFPTDGRTVETYPIGTGDQAGMTPTGTTRVAGKTAHPTWYVPKSIRAEDPTLPAAMPPGPDNPLGDYALRLGWPSYLIHGTNKPYGVGRNVSHGCIHLYPEDIEKLFGEVKIGTPVRVVNNPMHLAWDNGQLYLALAPSHDQMVEISENQSMSVKVPDDLFSAVAHAAGDQVTRVNWDLVAKIGQERPGMPIAVTAGAPANPAMLQSAAAPIKAMTVKNGAPPPGAMADDAPANAGDAASGRNDVTLDPEAPSAVAAPDTDAPPSADTH